MSILDASYAVFFVTKNDLKRKSLQYNSEKETNNWYFKEIDILKGKKCLIDLVSHEIQRIYLLNLLLNGVTHPENDALRRFFVDATLPFL